MASEQTKIKHALKETIEDLFSTETFGKSYGSCDGFVTTKKIKTRTGQMVGKPRYYYVTGERKKGHDDCGDGEEWSDWEEFDICIAANGKYKAVEMERCNFIRGIREPPCNKDVLDGSEITGMWIRSTQYGSDIRVRDADKCEYVMDLSEFNKVLNDLQFDVTVPQKLHHLEIKPIEDIEIIFK